MDKIWEPSDALLAARLSMASYEDTREDIYDELGLIGKNTLFIEESMINS